MMHGVDSFSRYSIFEQCPTVQDPGGAKLPLPKSPTQKSVAQVAFAPRDVFVPHRPRTVHMEEAKNFATSRQLSGHFKFFSITGEENLIAVEITESETQPKLKVDQNGNGQFDDDPEITWSRRPSSSDSMIEEGVFSVLGSLGPCHMEAYRYLGPDDRLKFYFYPIYALKGQLQPPGQTPYDFLVYDNGATGNFTFPRPAHLSHLSQRLDVYIDGNRNGKFEPGECVQAWTPFFLDGQTHLMKSLDVSSQKVSFTHTQGLDPEAVRLSRVVTLQVGENVPGLIADAISPSGEKIDLRQQYRNKLVLVDFWTTWCGPCIAEVPNLIKARERFSAQGFEIIGICCDLLDQKANPTLLPQEILGLIKQKNMSWPQLHDGNGGIAPAWGVTSYPSLYLVDGSSGQLLATGNDLRGEKLHLTLEAFLNKKKEKEK